MEKITLAGGCFWCTEAIFQRLKGVTAVTSGYSGGNMENPNYEKVSTGTTEHAERIQIEFDPKIISLETILEVFFATHDPTTKDRQGADMGTQYRSMIFYNTDEQKQTAQKALEKAQKDYKNKIVTEIVPFKDFYEAEDYHQNYYENNKSNMYCNVVISPKIKKLIKEFPSVVR